MAKNKIVTKNEITVKDEIMADQEHNPVITEQIGSLKNKSGHYRTNRVITEKIMTTRNFQAEFIVDVILIKILV